MSKQTNNTPPPGSSYWEWYFERSPKETIIHDLRLTIDWIENLMKEYGREKVLDQMPNNYGGTLTLQGIIARLEKGA